MGVIDVLWVLGALLVVAAHAYNPDEPRRLERARDKAIAKLWKNAPGR